MALNSCSLAALVGGADKNFLAAGAIDSSRLQQQRQTECSLLSAYCLTILMLCGWRCRQRLAATAGDSEFCPPCIGSAKVLTFFFLYFYGHFSTEKIKRKFGCFFGRKIKRRKIKNAFSGAEKEKENEIRSASTYNTVLTAIIITKVTIYEL